MSNKIFVDTKIIVYSRDQSGVISTQVLDEYYVTVTKKLKPGMSQEDARENICALMAWGPLPIDMAILNQAKLIEEKYTISWRDSMIVAAAKIGGCKTIYSEDLSNGQIIEGIKIVNPFLI